MSKKIRNLRVVRDTPFAPGPIEEVIIQGSAGGGFGATGPTGATGATGTSGSNLQAPIITGIDSHNGIVYFDNPSGMQVEVWKYVRKTRGVHSGINTYPNRQGKRFRPYRQLPNGATSYTVQNRWINPISKVGPKANRRNYFKLAARDPITGDRGPLTAVTISTAVNFEYNVTGFRTAIRIILHPHNATF